jgi:hypothetical protein
MWVSIFLLPPPWHPGKKDGVQPLLLCGGTKSAPPGLRLGPMACPSPPSGRLWPPPPLLLVHPSFLPSFRSFFLPSGLLPGPGELPALLSPCPVCSFLLPRPGRRLTPSQSPALAAKRSRHHPPWPPSTAISALWLRASLFCSRRSHTPPHPLLPAALWHRRKGPRLGTRAPGTHKASCCFCLSPAFQTSSLTLQFMSYMFLSFFINV